MSQVCNIVVAGVGGQGVLSTARLLGRASTIADLDVRAGQIYGLSQRGGSVESTVRIGPIGTAFISAAEADVVIGFEPLEALRIIPRMSATTTVLINQTPIVPASLTLDRSAYPEFSSIVEEVETVAGVVHQVDGNTMAEQAGDHRLLNIVMLGVLAGFDLLPVPGDILAEVAKAQRSEADPEPRKKAFQLGKGFAQARLLEGSKVRDQTAKKVNT